MHLLLPIAPRTGRRNDGLANAAPSGRTHPSGLGVGLRKPDLTSPAQVISHWYLIGCEAEAGRAEHWGEQPQDTMNPADRAGDAGV